MKSIGFWKEYLEDGDNPSIRNEQFGTGLPNMQILEYLKKGISLGGCRDGHLDCVLRKDYAFRVHDFYTDGEYVWTSGLIDYYEKMNIILPQEFINHIVNQKYIPPQFITKEQSKEGNKLIDKYVFGDIDVDIIGHY